MKVALCISGQMRSFQECYPSQYENLIKLFQPDIFIHTWSEVGQSIREEKSTSSEDSFLDLSKELESLFSPKKMVIEDYSTTFSDSYKGVTVPDELKKAEPVSYKGALPMFYKIWACHQLCIDYASEHGFEYDLVIRLRPDLYIDEPLHELEGVIENNNLLYLGHLTNVFASDRIAAGSQDAMTYYCSVWSKLADYWQNPLQDGKKDNFLVGERLMRWHLRWSSLDCKAMRGLSHIKRYDLTLTEIHKKLFKKKVSRFFKELWKR